MQAPLSIFVRSFPESESGGPCGVLESQDVYIPLPPPHFPSFFTQTHVAGDLSISQSCQLPQGGTHHRWRDHPCFMLLLGASELPVAGASCPNSQ